MTKWKILSYILIFTLLTNIGFPSFKSNWIYAADEIFDWNRNDTLDAYLYLVENKAGDSDLLLEHNMALTGTYSLVYYPDNDQRVTVTFVQQYDNLSIRYKTERFDGTNITQNLVDLSYLEMNYDLEVPDWQFIDDKTVNGDGELEFNVESSAGSLFPGAAFEINNKRVIIKWDFQGDKVYYLFDGYIGGNIMPITYTDSQLKTRTIKALKIWRIFR